MLPWRRSKFVLVEDQAKSKAKSLGGAGLTYHSILSSLLHSCPDLLPDFPLNWVSSLFQTKRQKVELNKEEPVYNARYLGSVVTITAKGSGCTQEAVGKIWTRSNYGEQSLKMRLTVGPQGLRMSPDKRKKPTHVYSLDRITCCAADPCRPKILAWVYRHRVKNMAVVLRCHAVLLSRSEKARRVARSLDRNATAAFGEFKRLKRQSDFRHRQQLLLGEDAVPLMPIRRLLNGQCHYRPPADSPAGSSARLAPIAEEEEEGEGEQQDEDKEQRAKEEEEEEEGEVEVEVEDEDQDQREKGKKEEGVREHQGHPGRPRVLTTSRDPTQLLSELALGDIAGLEDCQINFVNDRNNNTFTFITSLV
ncbi:unnamed protein product [Arctogadus glacialis]